MKRTIALLLALLLAFVFVGCQQQEPQSATATDESWTKVEQAGELIMGMDDAFPPMGYVDEQTGELIGFDLDIAKEVGSRLGIDIKFQAIEWNNKEMELNNGQVDCLWNGFSKTPERDEALNLSIPYMQNHQIILVKKDSEYQNLADLAGKRLGVQEDSSAEDALDSSVEFKNSLAEIVPVDDYAKAVLEIENGLIDAIAIDEVVAKFYVNKSPDAYRILTDENGEMASLAVEDYVIGFRKADNALKEKIEETLREMAKDGKLAEISKQWFGEDVTTVE